MQFILVFLLAALLQFVSIKATAYPEFIGYGYSTCITCHFNGHGNGPLNDYGRAVWAAEIAGRAYADDETDEQLGEASGFLGRTPMPWWLRPGVKTRSLQMQTSPNSASGVTRNIIMQADFNWAILFDKKADLAFIGALGYVPEPMRTQGQSGVEKPSNAISREHYIRWHQNKNLWWYFGLLDKVYGIRNVNHTAYSRVMTGLAQNDQSHSIIAHYIQPTWELTFDAFLGNLNQGSTLRQKGISLLYDYEIRTNWRLGTSLLSSTNEYVKNNRFAVHSRSGHEDGASLLWEVGLIQDTPATAGDSLMGYYTYFQYMQRLIRGYHLFVGAQSYKSDLKSTGADNLKANCGLLMFPRSRFEIRIEFENGRKVFEENVTTDTWALLTQLHISL